MIRARSLFKFGLVEVEDEDDAEDDDDEEEDESLPLVLLLLLLLLLLSPFRIPLLMSRLALALDGSMNWPLY